MTRVAIGCRMCLIEVITDKDDCSKELLEVRMNSVVAVLVKL
jgi:hypothetical protein